MLSSTKDLPTFIMFYHPKCPWCKKVFKEFEALGQKCNTAGTEVRIEAVNGSYSKTREELGVKTYPDFRLFRGGDPYGLHMKKDPSIRNAKGFTKFLKDNGIAECLSS